MDTARRAIAAVVAVAGAFVVGSAGCGSSASGVGLAQGCTLNSDCNSPLVCVFSRCHSACENSGDCPIGERCVSSDAAGGSEGNVCQLPSEETCSATSSCQSGQVCGSDQQCRATCTPGATTGCASGEYCLTTGSTSACYSPANASDDPSLMLAGIISADGSILSDASSASVPSRDGGGSSSGDDAGSAGSADGGGDATTDGGAGSSVEGTCPLPSVACGGNGQCDQGDGSYTCACFGGYIHDPSTNDPATCVLVDACLANDTCMPVYPCVDTMSPGQACRGEFATWHVSDPFASLDGGATVRPRYSNDGNGTMTDVVTSLVWQIDVPALHAGCEAAAPDAGADAAPGTSCTLEDSQSYCAALRTGGYDDWRLPTLVELESLLDYSQDEPPYIGSAFLPTVSGSYWTASPAEASPGENWFVDFSSDTAASTTGDANSAASVRCVHGTGISSSTPAAHYTIDTGAIDAGAGDAAVVGDAVVDNYTGLTWERPVSSAGLTWSDAVAYCEALGAGFRLPTLKELVTLVDPVVYNPSIDSETFPATPSSGWFWTSSALQPENGDYFSVSFSEGATNYFGSGDSNWVRCVH